MSHRSTLLLTACASLGLATPALAQVSISTARLSPSPIVSSFGSSAALDGDVLISGAPAAGASGEVHVYERGGAPDTWLPATTLTPAEPLGMFDFFGSEVAISGDLLVATTSNLSSRAWVFERSPGGVWTEVVELVPTSGAFSNGPSVTIDGDLVAVGDDGDSSSTGAVYLFGRDVGGPNAWGQHARITASDASAGHHFGSAVGLDGDTLVVGALAHSGLGSSAGAAYVFGDLATRTPTEQRMLQASDGNAGDRFGVAVDVDGDIVVVGARDASLPFLPTGKAYVFEAGLGAGWGERAILRPIRHEAGVEFGAAVAVSGDLILIGSPLDVESCPAFPSCVAGAFYAFGRNRGGMNRWGIHSKLLPPPGFYERSGQFGAAVAIDGYQGVVGAPGSYDVHVYRAEFHPTLSVTGSCPGPLVVAGAGAAPGAPVHLFSGSGPGSDAVGAGAPCAGTTSGLAAPTLVASTPASGAGAWSFSGAANASQCALHVQVLDGATCGASPTSALP